MPLSILIAGTDLNNLFQLNETIKSISHEFQVINLTASRETLLQAIHEHHQAVIFMETTLDNAGGSYLIKKAAENMLVVLMSSCGDFAVNAYQYGVVDYLIKPIHESRLRITLERVQKLLRLESCPDANLQAWFQIWTHEGTRVLHPKDVLYLQAEGNYVKVICKNCYGLLKKPLYAVKKDLGEDYFWQIHRKIVVNCNAIDWVIKQGEGGYLMLKNHPSKLRISRKFMTVFLEHTFAKKLS